VSSQTVPQTEQRTVALAAIQVLSGDSTEQPLTLAG
jgi:hypothetical protein